MLQRKNRFKLFREIGLGIMLSVLIIEMGLQALFFFEIVCFVPDCKSFRYLDLQI